MNNFKSTSKSKMVALMTAIAFVTYNVALFVICGFTGHGASFWISYIFMLLAFAALTAIGYAFKSCDIQPKDWLFGYPILKHCAIYIIVEFALSVLFMALDYANSPWQPALSVQIIALAVHAVFVISCFLAQRTIVDVQTKVKENTFFIKSLTVDAENLLSRAKTENAKAACKKVYEAARYSDPMSNGALASIESDITIKFSKLSGAVASEDSEAIVTLADEIIILLGDRNKKCKLLK